jgi:response regulator RpfG family c-di-GMP phosphodiesterase
LKGENIPLSARIFAVVDVWDAMCSKRPYHNAYTEKEVIAYIEQQSGVLFDPKVVDAFLKLYHLENED